MRWLVPYLAMALILSSVTYVTLAASPHQEKPPQPFGPDAFTGRVTVRNTPAPIGMRLFACIDGCATYKSGVVEVMMDGLYGRLVVEPIDRSLVGHSINFFLFNDFGTIQSVETVDFLGATDNFTLDLNFHDAVPVPTPTVTITPTASLPVPGDLSVMVIPRMTLIIGGTFVMLGAGIIIVARRRAA